MTAAKCPQCGNLVEPGKPCPFCAYSDSVGVPTEKVQKPPMASPRMNYELAVLNGFINSKFQLQKSLEQGFLVEMFEDMSSRRLAKLLFSLYDNEPKQEAWDRHIVYTKLQTSGHFDASLANFLNRVLNVPVPTMEQVITYLNLLKNAYGVRMLRELGEEMVNFSKQATSEKRAEIDKFTSVAVNRLRTVQRMAVNRRITLVKYEIQGIMQDLDYRQKHGAKEILGYSMKPFNILNATWSGLRKGFLYAIAGAPRRGKTNLTLDIATYVARENKVPVLFFTWEQTKRNLTYRLLSKESYINPDTLQRKQILGNALQKAKLAAGLKRMAEYQEHLYIIEATKDVTIDRVRGHAYNVMQEWNTNNVVIFIDYIQKVPLAGNLDNEKIRTEEISTALKGLTIELNCPIVAISSLSKDGCAIDQADNEMRPTMYHCKGSGDIEYDLDAAAILAKDWADTAELSEQLKHKAEAMGKDPHRIPKIDIVNLYIEKNRDAPEGVMGCIQYFFFIEENKFIELGYKIETDAYRFSKIETLVGTLVDKEFIKFYDISSDGAPSAGSRDFNWDGARAGDDGGAKQEKRKKIRLKW